jgi:cytochrome-b5 reductase
MSGSSSIVSPMVKQSYQLLKKTRLSSDSFLLRCGLPEHRPFLGLDPLIPTCIKVDFEDPNNHENNKVISKSYSPVTHPSQPNYFDLVVKEYPYREGGGVGAHLCNMQEGDSITASLKKERMMHGSSSVLNRGWKHVGLVAGGTGIAPLLQIARILLESSNDENEDDETKTTKIHLLFVNHTREDVLGRETIEELAAAHPDRFVVTYSFTREEETDGTCSKDGVASVLHGRGDVAMARSALPSPLEEGTMVFVCGRDGFVAHWAGPVARAPPKPDGSKGPKIQGPLLGVLQEAGYTADQVFKY